jgi:hypothetical protein
MRPCSSGITSAAKRGGISQVITAHRTGQLG